MIDYLRMYLAIFGLWPGIPVKQQISFVIIRKPYIHSYHEERDSNKPEFAGGISSGCHLL